MKIMSQPFFTRPGYKLYTQGAAALDTAELLAVVLWDDNKKEGVLARYLEKCLRVR